MIRSHGSEETERPWRLLAVDKGFELIAGLTGQSVETLALR